MSEKKITGYDLSRNWFDWAFENSGKVNPNHTALYFYIVEHCNRLGWKPIFGLPSAVAMEAIGIRSYNTYIKTLNELIALGFIKMIEKSKNQYTANIIALSNINKALDKALDKALIKHTSKQSESTVQSIDSIIKQINKEPLNKEQKEGKPVFDFGEYLQEDFYNACIEVWFRYNEGWQFEAKDGTGIKGIIKKIIKAQEKAGKPISPETVAAAFEFILDGIKTHKYYCTCDPTTLSSKFNNILKELKNSSNGTTNDKRATAYANSIFA